jgi:hypothetical protein
MRERKEGDQFTQRKTKVYGVGRNKARKSIDVASILSWTTQAVSIMDMPKQCMSGMLAFLGASKLGPSRKFDFLKKTPSSAFSFLGRITWFLGQIVLVCVGRLESRHKGCLLVPM